jgi:tungstate transport system substrate-binding protein
MKIIPNQNIKMVSRDSAKGFILDHKKALAVIAILAVAGVTTGFIVFEFTRSEQRMILATTTSTYDSGLLDVLLPEFTKDTGIQVDVVSVGTGQALQNGRDGNCDMILVHARSREDEFVAEKYGIHRTCVMYNDFILVGPKTNDPAGILDPSINITQAFQRIYAGGEEGNTTFHSRGDDSGTHTKEKALWAAAGYDYTSQINIPGNTWYEAHGAGMGDTLVFTDQDADGYTLADRGTWLSAKANLENLKLVYNSTEVELLNPYGAIPIDPWTHSHVKYNFALKLTAFFVSEKGQNMIGNYTVSGEVLFTPCFGICNHTHGCSTTQQEIDFWTRYNGGFTQPAP